MLVLQGGYSKGGNREGLYYIQFFTVAVRNANITSNQKNTI